MIDVLILRRSERVHPGDYPDGFMESLNARLDAIAAEIDIEPIEACS